MPNNKISFNQIKFNYKKYTIKKVLTNTINFYVYIVITTLILVSCSQQKQPNRNNQIKDYAVLSLTPKNNTSFTDFPATISGENTVEIRPMVDGYLEAIYVKEGATVKKGQLLFKIKNPQFEQAVVSAKAAINIAEANVNTAKINVEKVKPLVEKNIVSKFELESVQNTLLSNQAVLEQAKAALDNATTNLNYTYIKSPKSGVISTIPYRIGALVTSNSSEPLTILSDISKVEVYFSWNEKQLISFSNSTKGKTIQEKLSQLPPAILLLSDGTTYNEKGKLALASGIIDSQTGTATLKAVFSNPLGILQSGASAIVRIPDFNNNVLLIPQSATYEIQDKKFVYTVNAENKVISKPFIGKSTNNGQLYIVESGLTKGDKIVLNGFNIKDSTSIIPKLVKADSLYTVISKKTNQ